ncbi:MAG: right-handed parallel beta-helix repeat-containing protein [Planctomycetota bacterium]
MFKCVWLIFLSCVSVCLSSTWTVNLDGSGDFTDIQSAINAASPGDIIEIADGIYSGAGNQNISFLGKAITVKSQNGPDNCIIKGDNSTPSPNRGFIFESAETRDSVLEGVVIRDFWFLTCCEGGAGIYIADGDPTIRNCKVLNCQIELDMCPCQIYGAGIFVQQGSPLFEGCVVSGNGGAYYGGGIACGDDTANVWVFLTNCIIAENSASYGGGVYEYYYNCSQIKNCTVVNNSSYGLYCQNPPMPAPFSAPVIEGIFWGNIPNQSWGYNLLTSRNYTPAVGLDPKFVDPVNDDYHLQWDSPCIDYCQYAEYGPSDVDFDGEPRCMGQYVDAGADEVGLKQADFSRNGKIDLVDFQIFSSTWGMTPSDADWYLLCDLEKDDVIDANDLQSLCSDWLWQADWY